MITSVHIQNYRSFVDASVKLRPFSLVIGANGSGKSNFLKATFKACSDGYRMSYGDTMSASPELRHASHKDTPTSIQIGLDSDDHGPRPNLEWSYSSTELAVRGYAGRPALFRIDPDRVSSPEEISSTPKVGGDGSGTTQVLEFLKSGDREDLFDSIEAELKRCIPEIEKLSLQTVGQQKRLQVRERGLPPLPASELSEGTRIIIALVTILHQISAPNVILIEDIDYGLHPRLLERMVRLMRDIAERHQINIIATTHNPYLVDQFIDDKEAVIIVEKKDGASTLSTLADRLKGLDYESTSPEDVPLGSLWFSGLVGGIPLNPSRAS